MDYGRRISQDDHSPTRGFATMCKCLRGGTSENTSNKSSTDNSEVSSVNSIVERLCCKLRFTGTETFQSEGVGINVLECEFLVPDSFLEGADRLCICNFDREYLADIVAEYPAVEPECASGRHDLSLSLQI